MLKRKLTFDNPLIISGKFENVNIIYKIIINFLKIVNNFLRNCVFSETTEWYIIIGII